MWDKVSSEFVKYPTAVISWIDAAGYPTSIRCALRLDSSSHVLRFPVSHGLTLQAGPASLLCHTHDEKLGSLNNFNARGTLEQDSQGWLFRPTLYIPGTTNHVSGVARFILGGRRAAQLYLKKRGLKRPTVDWAAFQRLYKSLSES